MAELVDALGSGPSGGNTVEVRVLFWAPSQLKLRAHGLWAPNEHGASALNRRVPFDRTVQRAERSKDCQQDIHNNNRV
ncbi:MAG: hypothetical protein RIQ49_1654 [Pseudomonadota bacterium]|jgi:hypothetical protein